LPRVVDVAAPRARGEGQPFAGAAAKLIIAVAIVGGVSATLLVRARRGASSEHAPEVARPEVVAAASMPGERLESPPPIVLGASATPDRAAEEPRSERRPIQPTSGSPRASPSSVPIPDCFGSSQPLARSSSSLW